MSWSLDGAIEALIVVEGGYVNNPADKGGETNFGITAPVARAYGYQGPMKDLPRAMAGAIYQSKFWFGVGLDKVVQASAPIAAKLFDIGVNMGPAEAGKFLQRALNVLNQEGKAWPEVRVDGRVGPESVYALKQFIVKRAAPGENVMLEILKALQTVKYLEIAENNPTQEQFEFGWILNRVVN